MKVYKIRDMSTGLFKLGTTSTKWSPQGKVWLSLKALKSHLTLASSSRHGLEGSVLWEVIEYDVVEAEKYPVNAVKFGKDKGKAV